MAIANTVDTTDRNRKAANTNNNNPLLHLPAESFRCTNNLLPKPHARCHVRARSFN
jgi:hypothetical protein